MTSIDELFNKPGLASNKRKAEPLKDPTKIYKLPKLSAANGDIKHKVPVDDPEEEHGTLTGSEDGAEEQEGELQDDEEGRFFGGGVSKDTADVLDFIDERDGEETAEEKIDSTWLRRTALNFERRISKNAELRAKFEHDPQKFMGSEADLDADVKSLSILSEHPELYEDFAGLGCVGSLVSLLAHENTDIAIDAIEIIAELTDEDVEAEQKQWDSLVEALLEADLPNLLVQNLERLEELNESDRAGVYHSLSVLENLASQVSAAEKICESSTMLQWVLKRLQRKEPTVSQNKQYSAEVLAIFLQQSTSIRTSVLSQDAVDLLLQLLAAYRKNDPEKDSEEEEYVENVFDALTCLIESGEGKQKFIAAEGVELALIMLREGRFSKPRALRLLDHAMGGIEGALVCEKLVDSAGLKTIFGIFMKRLDHTMIDHILGIFASLLRSLPEGSASRVRTLAKFMEKDYEKVQKLVRLRRDYAQRLVPIDKDIQTERAKMTKDEQAAASDEWLSRRLDAGLYCVQTLNIVLAWLVAEDAEARGIIIRLLREQDEDLDDIKASLNERLTGFDADAAASDDEQANAADLLRTLIDCLS